MNVVLAGMTWKEFEFIFNRSMRFAYSKKKLFFTFPVLFVCGLMIVFCRALSVEASEWVKLSLTFLPIFLCTSFLLASGVVLVRSYHNEVKELPVSFRKIIKESWETMIGVSYLGLPIILGYLLLWTLLGLFYLVKEIPGVGDAIGVILSFGPFLLVLGSMILGVASVALLYFVTPQVALKNQMRLKLAEDVWNRIKGNAFGNIVTLFISLLPLGACVGLLSLAAWVTGASFFEAKAPLAIAMQWFFVMLPFCALLSPSVVFFFNFSAESYVMMKRKAREEVEEEELAGV